MLAGQVDLALDGGRPGQAALHGAFRQQGNLAGRHEQAVLVIRLDLLAGRGQVFAINEQIGLHLDRGDVGPGGHQGADRGGGIARLHRVDGEPKGNGICYDEPEETVEVGGNETHAQGCQVRPAPVHVGDRAGIGFGVACGNDTAWTGQGCCVKGIGHHNGARAGRLQARDTRCECGSHLVEEVGVRGDPGGTLRLHEDQVIVATVDEIEGLGIGGAVDRVEVVRNLSQGVHISGQQSRGRRECRLRRAGGPYSWRRWRSWFLRR